MRVGTLSPEVEWFKPRRGIEKEASADPQIQELRAMLEGVCAPGRLLALIRDFIVFEDGGGAITKNMAGCNQFHAVQAAVSETLLASNPRRAGDSDGGGTDYRAGAGASARCGIPGGRARDSPWRFMPDASSASPRRAIPSWRS